jgi:hypothetical protein
MPPLQSEQLNHNRHLAVKVLQSLRRPPSPTSGLAQVALHAAFAERNVMKSTRHVEPAVTSA